MIKEKGWSVLGRPYAKRQAITDTKLDPNRFQIGCQHLIPILFKSFPSRVPIPFPNRFQIGCRFVPVSFPSWLQVGSKSGADTVLVLAPSRFQVVCQFGSNLEPLTKRIKTNSAPVQKRFWYSACQYRNDSVCRFVP